MNEAPTVGPTKRHNLLSWASLGLAIVALFVFGSASVIAGLIALAGLVTGILGLSRAKATQRGQIPSYAGIVICCLIILMLISKLLLGPLKAHANESSAIYKLGLISQAEAKYRSAYPATGYACSLSSLGGLDESGSPSAEKAQLLPSNLAGGEGAGYTFEIVSCTKGTQNIADPYISYEITAVPREIGSTGERGFCADVQGTITVDPSGGTNCTQPLK